MIPKGNEKKDPLSHGDGNRGFEMPERYPIEKNDAERQKPVVIHLSDLNGDKGMPKNFHKKAGRVLPSLTRYWSPEEVTSDVNEAYDIE